VGVPAKRKNPSLKSETWATHSGLSRHYYRNLKHEIRQPIYLMAPTKTALCILFLLIDLVFSVRACPCNGVVESLPDSGDPFDCNSNPPHI
jgi:hypothetical protein